MRVKGRSKGIAKADAEPCRRGRKVGELGLMRSEGRKMDRNSSSTSEERLSLKCICENREQKEGVNTPQRNKPAFRKVRHDNRDVCTHRGEAEALPEGGRDMSSDSSLSPSFIREKAWESGLGDTILALTEQLGR